MIDWKECIVDSNGNTLSDEQREPDNLPPLQLDGHCLVALGLAHSCARFRPNFKDIFNFQNN
jgi:hypothetical protein